MLVFLGTLPPADPLRDRTGFQLVTAKGRESAPITYVVSLPCCIGYGAESFTDLLTFRFVVRRAQRDNNAWDIKSPRITSVRFFFLHPINSISLSPISTLLYLKILAFTMVTLNHQNFWHQTPNSPQRCCSVGSGDQTIVVAEQLNTSRENREASDYSLENNVQEEEDRVMNFGKLHS